MSVSPDYGLGICVYVIIIHFTKCGKNKTDLWIDTLLGDS